MRARLISVLAFVLLVVSASMASAQGGGRGFGRGGGFGPGGGMQMLRYPEVQKELKMTPDQVTKLGTKQQEVQQAMREARQGINPQDMTDEDRQNMMAKMQEIQNKAVADILEPTQMKRFHQLELQQAGPMAFTRKDVATELKLTDDQKDKIKDIQMQIGEDMRSAMQSLGVDFRNMSAEDRAKMNAKRNEINKAASDKIVALLTDDQKKSWKDMLGDPFKFPQGPPPRPAGAGGQGV